MLKTYNGLLKTYVQWIAQNLQWIVRNFDETRFSPTSNAGCSARHLKIALLSAFETGSVSLEIEVQVRDFKDSSIASELLRPREFSCRWPVWTSCWKNHLVKILYFVFLDEKLSSWKSRVGGKAERVGPLINVLLIF